MLMRSMPSVYSPMRGSGITTSSFTLNALVCLAMAAVRLRSAQNFLRASALTATKPSPLRPLARRMTSLVGAGHAVFVVTDDVTDQHHLGQAIAAHRALALGGVADGLEVAVVEVLQAGQDGAARLRHLGEHEVLDLDDRGHAQGRVAEELQAHRAGVLGHAVHDPAAAGDQAVAAFLLDAGQARQELVGDVFPQAFLAEGAAGDVELFGAQVRLAVGCVVVQLEAGHLDVVDLAQVVVDANHFQPFGVGRDHAPRGQVVERGAPQHGFLAAGVHGDVAAHARGLGRGRVHGEHIAGALGRIGHALGDDARTRPDGGHLVLHAGQVDQLDLGHRFELLGVDDPRSSRSGARRRRCSRFRPHAG